MVLLTDISAKHLGSANFRLSCAKRVLIETTEFGLRTITPLLMTTKQFEFVFCKIWEVQIAVCHVQSVF